MKHTKSFIKNHHPHALHIRMMHHHQEHSEEEEENKLIAEREKRLFIVCSIPIVCIAVISFFYIIVEHAPFFNGNCREVKCVAGTTDQFIMWSFLSILLVIVLLQFIYRRTTFLNPPPEYEVQERLWAST